VAQLLRNIQEALGEGEFRVGSFYHKKGSFPAAANRLQTLVDAYPLYSQADEALWELGDSYAKMGNRFRDRAGQSYTRIVKDYPLSPRVEEAKKILASMELPVPEADPVALARMKYEEENRTRASLAAPVLGVLRRGPDVRTAAKSGQPAMTPLRPSIPASVPVPAGAAGTSTDVVIEQSNTGTSALDTQPDARQIAPGSAASAGGAANNGSASNPAAAGSGANAAAPAPGAAGSANEPLPTNHPVAPKNQKKQKAPKPPKASTQKQS
jgi:outer membrane protein assembly factor BamD